MKAAVIIVTYNIDSRVFILQIEAIKKFCTDDYVIHVIDNGFDKENSKHIAYHCADQGVSYRKTKSGSKNSSDSHCFALKFACDMFLDKYDLFLFLDHDCIPVKPFSILEVLGTKLMAGVGQGAAKKYLWVGCLFCNLSGVDKSLFDLSYSHEYGLDTGGNLYKLIEKYGEENFIFFDEVYCQLDGFTGKHGYYTLLNDGMFIHYVNASNWEGIDRHGDRINALLNISLELMKENVD